MKTISTPPTESLNYWLPTLQSIPGELGVDKESRVISGATIIQRGSIGEGDARPWKFDDVSLAQVVDFAAKGARGLKGRATHPNASNDGLGKFTGWWKNLRLSEEGDRVIGDHHFSEAAFRGGEESLGSMLMSLARKR